jgi:hypothetical protein
LLKERVGERELGRRKGVGGLKEDKDTRKRKVGERRLG